MRSSWPGRAKTTLKLLSKAGLLVAGLALAACQTDGAPLAETAMGPAVAFDRIEGPPRAVFDELVAALGPAADAHKVHVVSRKEDAPYRVKGYLSLEKAGAKSAVSYAWEVYGADGARITRLTGDAPLAVPSGTSDPWSACDEKVLTQIADRTMAALAETLAEARAPAVASAPLPASPPAQAGGSSAPQPSASPSATRAAALLADPQAAAPSSLAYAAR